MSSCPHGSLIADAPRNRVFLFFKHVWVPCRLPFGNLSYEKACVLNQFI